MKDFNCRSLLVAVALAASISVTRAVPYASGLTNNGDTVSFVLNENADNVKVILDGTTTIDLGALTRGTRSFSLAGTTTFQIVVTNAATNGWSLISSDANTQTQIPWPRGVAVNTNPAIGKLFGRTYVANAVSDYTSVVSARQTTEGIYILNADQSDALGRGNTASTAGITFDPGNLTSFGEASPWRIELDKIGYLYVADYSSNTATLYRTDPDVNSNVMILKGQGVSGNPTVHTTIGSIAVTGTPEAGNLVVYAHDGNKQSSFNNIMRWNINSGTLPWNTAPTVLTTGRLGVRHLQMDLDISPSGKLYEVINRSAGTDAAGLRVVDASAGTVLWDSLTVGGSPDLLKTARGIKLSPDELKIALIRDDNSVLVIPLTNSFPDMGAMYSIPAFPTSPTAGRDVAWDLAGNLYAVSAGRENLRVFSPGGTTTATTGNDTTGTNGTFSLTVAAAPNPSLTVQPIPQTVIVGATATFSVIAAGTGPFTYQWKTNGINISGATASSYAKANCQLTDSGKSFSVVVTGANGTITSSPVTLTVISSLPIFGIQPLSITTNAGVNVTFVGAAYNSPTNYTWKFNGTTIAGQTNQTLIRTNVQLGTLAGYYTLVASNTVGGTTSAVAELKIIDGAPVITNQPVSISTNAGTSAKFTVSTTGSDPRTYQWQSNGTNIAGATTTAYTRSDVQQSTAGPYQVIIGNPFGTTASAIALLTVTNTDPIITTQPVGKTVTAGSNVTFTVATTGTDPRTYQWFFDNGSGATQIASATNTSLVITNSQVADSGTYTVQVTNPGSPATSSPAALVVNSSPVVFITQPKSVTNNAGANVTFTASAFGDAPIVWNWTTNGGAVPTATTNSMTLTNVQVSDSGMLVAVTISNSTSGPLASTNATLTVTNKIPTIITQPTNFAGIVNGSATNTVVAQGNDPLSYQWMFNTTNTVSGATSSTLVLNNLQTANIGNYSVVITDSAGSVTSSVVLLSVATNTPASGTGTGIQAEIFPDLNLLTTPASYVPLSPFSFTNTPFLTRVDTNIDIIWAGSPDPSIASADYFVARWTGQIQPLYSETYTFYTKSDDGIRVWINGQLFIDKFISGGNQNYTTTVSNLVAGQKYDLRVEFCDVTGSAEAHLSWYSPSQLKQIVPTSQLYTNSGPYVLLLTPTNPVVNAGGSTTLTAFCGGTGPLTYQWTLNGNNVPTGTSSALSLNNAQLADAGTYNVVVSNAYTASGITSPIPAVVYVPIASTPGTGTGLNAEYYSNMPQVANTPLNLTNGPTFIRTDAAVDYNYGTSSPDINISPDKFAVRWSGQIQPLYSQIYTFYTRSDDGVRLWVDGQLIIDKWVGQAVAEWNATMSYAFNANQKYNIVLEYFEGTSFAEVHLLWSSLSQSKSLIQTTQLYASSGPTITVQPLNLTTNVGSNVTFTATTVGTATLNYHWQKDGGNLSNGGNISGATTSTLTVSSAQVADAGTYTLLVNNSIGSILSSNAVLTLNGVAPTISSQPQSLTMDQGSNATFSVTASGVPAPTYQWTFNTGNISGETNNTLLLTNVQPTAVGNYAVIVTNSFGGLPSSTATLSVRPLITSSLSGNNLTISWSGTYTLQSSTNVATGYIDVTGNSPYIIDVTSGSQQFYRLKQ